MPSHRQRTTQTVDDAIAMADRLLPGVAAPDGEEDPRWQAIIEVGEYITSDPERVWDFIVKWASHEDTDLRSAVATCLLEHLLGEYFDAYFPRVEQCVISDAHFADTFFRCWKMGQAESGENASRFDALQSRRR